MKLYIKLNMYSSKTFVRWWKKHKKKNVRKTTISSLLCIMGYSSVDFYYVAFNGCVQSGCYEPFSSPLNISLSGGLDHIYFIWKQTHNTHFVIRIMAV